MEDKIEVGEYVRTEKGIIFEFQKVDKEDKGDYMWGSNYNGCYKEDIVKHSKNIIDLIEAGDYVNDYKVISVDYDVVNPYIDCIELDLNNNYQYNFISINQIKSIVTKEMMKQVEYRIE